MNTQRLWQSVLAELELFLSSSKFSLFFSKTFVVNRQSLGKKKYLVTIAVPHAYARDIIEKHYLEQVQKSLNRITGCSNKIKLIIKSFKQKVSPKTDSGPLFQTNQALKKEQEKQIKNALYRARISPELSFKNFAVSPTNEVAYAAATAVAKNPGRAYNPLFLYGGVGVGKTHLMQAIAQEIIKKSSQTSLIYCMGEEFTNEIIEAIRGKKTEAFKRRYRSSGVLLIDDIQFIAGKTTVQEEFFHTFNAVKRNDGQIVLTSDRPPSEIKLLEDRLRSRFEGGLTIDIQEPNFELRTAILLIKSQQLKNPLSMDVAQLVAASISSTRKLEGFLSRLAAEANLHQKPISIEMAQSLLKESSNNSVEAKPIVRPKEIIDVVARHFDLKQNQIKSPVRSRTILIPRQLAMYLLRRELKIPFTDIGLLFGGKDHSTVMHSVKKMSQLLGSSEELRLELSAIRKKLYE